MISKPITARRGEKGTPDFQEAHGSCNVYTEQELAGFVKVGLLPEHAPLVNEIVVIRAQDALRRTLEDTSVAGQVKKALKASPEIAAQLKAVLAQAAKKK